MSTFDLAVPRAGLAAAAGHVEREVAGAQAARLRASAVAANSSRMPSKRLHVRTRVRARRAADRRLVDEHHVVDVGRAVDRVVRAHGAVPSAQRASGGATVDHVVHEGRLAGARDAGHAGQSPSGMRTSTPLRLCARASRTCQPSAVALRARARHRCRQLSAQALAGQAAAVAQQLGVGALEDDAAALLARARTQVDDVVGLAMMARSCSTTRTVLPWSRSAFSTPISRSVSEGAGRWTARRARTACPPTRCRARPRARCAAPRRPTAFENGRSSVR